VFFVLISQIQNRRVYIILEIRLWISYEHQQEIPKYAVNLFYLNRLSYGKDTALFHLLLRFCSQKHYKIIHAENAANAGLSDLVAIQQLKLLRSFVKIVA